MGGRQVYGKHTAWSKLEGWTWRNWINKKENKIIFLGQNGDNNILLFNLGKVDFLPLKTLFIFFLEYSCLQCCVQVYSKMNQLYRYIYTLFLKFFSHIDHYRVLSRVSCAIQEVLIIYFTNSSVYMSIPISQFIPHYFFPLVNIGLFSTICDSISVS